MTDPGSTSAMPRQVEVEGALQALRRARVRAEEIARATGTVLIEWRDGRTVRVDPRSIAENSRDGESART